MPDALGAFLLYLGIGAVVILAILIFRVRRIRQPRKDRSGYEVTAQFSFTRYRSVWALVAVMAVIVVWVLWKWLE